MIHYQLRCKDGHAFDGWFKDSATFDKQATRKLVECPECGDTSVERALMAPAVLESVGVSAGASAGPGARAAAGGGRRQAAREDAGDAAAHARRDREECDYVGPDFAEEARRIHRGEVDQRPIYGEASDEQTESLEEEGISVARIPWVPRADG